MSPPAYQRAERPLLGTQLRLWYAAQTAQRAVPSSNLDASALVEKGTEVYSQA